MQQLFIVRSPRCRNRQRNRCLPAIDKKNSKFVKLFLPKAPRRGGAKNVRRLSAEFTKTTKRTVTGWVHPAFSCKTVALASRLQSHNQTNSLLAFSKATRSLWYTLILFIIKCLEPSGFEGNIWTSGCKKTAERKFTEWVCLQFRSRGSLQATRLQ